MELVAIQMARAVAFLEVESLDPKGGVTAPEGLRGFGARYSFEKVPQNLADVDFQKGVVFGAGRFEDIAIDQIVMYHNGIAIDTRSSTDNSLLVLQDILDYAKRNSGATIVPRRKHLISQVIFRSSLRLALLNPLLQPIADRLAKVSSQALNGPVTFEPTALLIGPDVSQSKTNPSVFSIERRAEIPFNENTYFSSAPVSTSEHIQLIEEVEGALTPR